MENGKSSLIKVSPSKGPFKDALTALISAHNEELNELKKVMNQEKDEWRRERTELNNKIERLRKANQEIREAHNDMQFLLEQYKQQYGQLDLISSSALLNATHKDNLSSALHSTNNNNNNNYNNVPTTAPDPSEVLQQSDSGDSSSSTSSGGKGGSLRQKRNPNSPPNNNNINEKDHNPSPTSTTTTSTKEPSTRSNQSVITIDSSNDEAEEHQHQKEPSKNNNPTNEEPPPADPAPFYGSLKNKKKNKVNSADKKDSVKENADMEGTIDALLNEDKALINLENHFPSTTTKPVVPSTKATFSQDDSEGSKEDTIYNLEVDNWSSVIQTSLRRKSPNNQTTTLSTPSTMKTSPNSTSLAQNVNISTPIVTPLSSIAKKKMKPNAINPLTTSQDSQEAFKRRKGETKLPTSDIHQDENNITSNSLTLTPNLSYNAANASTDGFDPANQPEYSVVDLEEEELNEAMQKIQRKDQGKTFSSGSLIRKRKTPDNKTTNHPTTASTSTSKKPVIPFLIDLNGEGQTKEPDESTSMKQSDQSEPKPFKFSEVVRRKADREQLPGHECEECAKFYDAIDGGGFHFDRKKFVNECSKHKQLYSPPDTPENFWQVSFPDTETQDPATGN